MKTIYTLLGVVLVSMMALTGGAAAAGGLDVADAVTEQFNGPGSQGPAGDALVAQNGSNSPWVTGDERLETFQERFDLTDDQVATIQAEVTTLIEADASPEEVRTAITDRLADYGVENPALGPPTDGRQAAGPFGHADGAGQGQGHGPADGTGYRGQNANTGPQGPADGSCLD